LTNIIGPLNNVSSVQLNQILEKAVGSITGCLLSCSNQGFCTYDSVTNKIGCVCNQFFTGSSCQYDSRPCSSNPCLNSGNCTNLQNSTLFTCECDSFHTGVYCENQIDLCLNSTCVPNQGYCKVTDTTTATCICLYGYEGVNCDQKLESLKTQKTIVSITSILAIVILGSFWCLILFMDYLKYFVIKDKRQKDRKKSKNSKEFRKSELFQSFSKANDRSQALVEPSTICRTQNKSIKNSTRKNVDKCDKSLEKFKALKEEILKKTPT
jgi:hypothetical protein